MTGVNEHVPDLKLVSRRVELRGTRIELVRIPAKGWVTLAPMRLRPDLIVAPEIQSGRGSERKVTWLELFYDLVFVVAVGQVSIMLYDNLSWMGVLGFLFVLMPVWWAWAGQTFYLTRFDSDDLIHRGLSMTQMFAVSAMALSIGDALTTRQKEFALAYVIIRAILVFEYARVHRHVPEARPLTARYCGGFGLAASLWLISLFVDPSFRLWLWGIAMVIDFGTPFVAGQAQFAIPPRHHHLPERFGLFTIIVLGEGVLSVVNGLTKAGMGFHTLVTAILGWICFGAIWWSYFEGVQGAESRAPLNAATARSFRIWLYTHLPLTASVLAIAMTIKACLTLEPWAQLKPEVLFIMVGAHTLAMFCMNVISRTAPHTYCNLAFRKFLFAHGLVNALIPLIAVAGLFVPGTVALGLLAVAWIAQVVLSLREESLQFRPGGSH